jgi:hypothetical protein
MHFVKESIFPVSAEKLWAFHERPDAFALLTPPWQKTEILQPPRSLEVGTKVFVRVKAGPIPFWQTVEAEHVAYEKGRMFADRMNKGPFSKWLHRHLISPVSEHESRLVDDIEYELPLGPLGRMFGSGIAKHELEKLFSYRHEITRKTLLEMA